MKLVNGTGSIATPRSRTIPRKTQSISPEGVQLQAQEGWIFPYHSSQLAFPLLTFVTAVTESPPDHANNKIQILSLDNFTLHQAPCKPYHAGPWAPSTNLCLPDSLLTPRITRHPGCTSPLTSVSPLLVLLVFYKFELSQVLDNYGLSPISIFATFVWCLPSGRTSWWLMSSDATLSTLDCL